MKFNLTCPVELDSLIINEETKSAEVTFLNLESQTITAIKYTVILFNETGEIISETPAEINGIELKAGDILSSSISIESAANADIRFTEITFEDETILAVENQEIEITYDELSDVALSRFEKAGAPEAMCYAKEEEAYWLCVCGRPNLPNVQNCVRCHREKEATLTDFATEESVAMTIVKKEEADALEAEKLAAEIAEELAAKNERLKKKLKKAGKIALIVIAAIVVIYFAFRLIVTSIGDSSAKEGDYAKAYSMYKLAGAHDKIDEIADGLYGNTTANLLSKGILAQDDDNIYYIALDTKIHKKDKATGEVTVLEGAQGTYLNATGDWIYYINDPQNKMQLWRISPDGKTNEVVYENRVYFAQTVGNDIYFITDRIEPLDEKDPASAEKSSSPLYLLKDGETDPKLISDADIAVYTVYGDKIYYLDYNDKSLYTMSLSGKNTKKLIEGPVYRYDIANGKLYYVTDPEDGSEIPTGSSAKLFVSNLNGKNAKPLLEDTSLVWVTVSGDSIYYMDVNQQRTVLKYNPEGEPTVIAKNINNINICGDTVLYIAEDEAPAEVEEGAEAVLPDLKMYLTNQDKSGYDIVSSLNEIMAMQPEETEGPPTDNMPTP